MTNLWAFMLLGFLAQASNGCVQIAYNKIEELIANLFSGIFVDLKGKPLSNIDVWYGSNSVTAKSVSVDDAAVTSIDTVFNSESKMSIKATGSVTISSEGFSTATFWYSLNLETELLITDGYSYWNWVPGSFSLSTESPNSVTWMDGTEVCKDYEEKCQLLVKGLCEGAIHSTITSMNIHNAKLTENFKYNDLTCNYKINHHEMKQKSIAIYIILSCDNVGPLNDAESLVLNKMNPGETIILYLEEKLCSNLLASLAVDYKGIITKDEWNGTFSHDTGDLWISFTSKSFPVCSISTAESKAAFVFLGSVKDASENELVNVTFIAKVDVTVRIISGIVKPSLGAAAIGQVTSTSAVESCNYNDTIQFLESIILTHLIKAVYNLSCKLEEFKAPDALGVTPNNANCSHQDGQIYCVQN